MGSKRLLLSWLLVQVLLVRSSFLMDTGENRDSDVIDSKRPSVSLSLRRNSGSFLDTTEGGGVDESKNDRLKSEFASNDTSVVETLIPGTAEPRAAKLASILKTSIAPLR